MMTRPTALRRYNRSVLILCALYAAGLFVAEWAIDRNGLRGPLAYALALLPALPIVGVFAAIGRYLVEEEDEYVRMLEVRKTLIASAFALSVATVYGFLESFALVPPVESFYLAVLWFGGLGVGACVNRLTVERAA